MLPPFYFFLFEGFPDILPFLDFPDILPFPDSFPDFPDIPESRGGDGHRSSIMYLTKRLKVIYRESWQLRLGEGKNSGRGSVKNTIIFQRGCASLLIG